MIIPNRLRKNQGFIKYFRNTSWLFVDKIVKIFIELIVVIWLARYLGPDQFGLLNYILSVVFIFSAISSLGLDGIIVREVVNRPKLKNLILGTAFYLKIIGSLIAIVLVYITTQTLNDESQIQFLIFIISLTLIIKSFNVIEFYFQAQVLSKYAALSSIVSNLITSMTKIGLIVFEAPLELFLYVYILESAIISIMLVKFYMQFDMRINQWKFKSKIAYVFLKDSWPLIFSAMMISLYMRVDQIMLKHMLDSSAVGQYVVATRLAEAWYFIPALITTSLFPAILNAKKTNQQLYSERIQKLYDLLIWFSIVIAIPITFLSNDIIELLYGEKYSESGLVLAMYVWATLFVSISSIRGKWQIAENLTKLHLIGAVVSGSVNILLNLLLIPIYGIEGAALASLISLFIAGYGLNYLFKVLHGHITHVHNAFNIVRIVKNIKLKN